MKRIARGAVVAFMLCCMAGIGYSADHGDLELLKLVADIYEANQEKLKTWRGEAVVQMLMSDDAGTLLSRTEHASFALDKAKELYRYNWTASDVRERREDGLRAFPDMIMNQLITQDRFYKFASDGYFVQGKPYPTLVVEPKESAKRQARLRQFAPLRLSCPISSDMPAHLRGLYDNAKLFEGLRVTRTGDTVIVEQPAGHAKATSIRWEFAVDKGGSLTKVTTADWRSDQEWTIEYAEHGSAWVPRKSSVRCTPREGSGSKKISKDIVLTSSEVNMPLSPSEFTLEALGVTQATRVSDNILGIAYWRGGSPMGDELEGKESLEEPLSTDTGTEGLSTSSARASGAVEGNNDKRAGRGQASAVDQPAAAAHAGDLSFSIVRVIACVTGAMAVILLALRISRIRRGRTKEATDG